MGASLPGLGCYRNGASLAETQINKQLAAFLLFSSVTQIEFNTEPFAFVMVPASSTAILSVKTREKMSAPLLDYHPCMLATA